MVERLIGEQFKGKDKLIPPNIEALHMGRDYARERPRRPLRPAASRAPTRSATASSSTATTPRRWAASMAAPRSPPGIRSRRRPRWPKPSQRHCQRFRVDPETGKNRFAIVQAEDELAAIGIVIGAGWNGARAFTATSGPGISLMQEFLGPRLFRRDPGRDLRRAARRPVDRHADAHAAVRHPRLRLCQPRRHQARAAASPRTRTSASSSRRRAFDLADRLQTPIFVMHDLDIGMNDWLCEPFNWDDARRYDRGKVMTSEELEAGKEFGRYLDVDGDGIPYRTLPGTHPTKGAYFTRGTSRDRYANYSEEGADYVDNMQRLLRKFETAKRLVPRAGRARGAPQPTRYGRHLFRLDRAGDGRGARRAGRSAASISTRCASAPSRSPTRSSISSTRTTRCSWSSRTATRRCARCSSTNAAIDPARFISVLHYDGTPITARFIAGEIAAAAGRR